MNIKLAIKNLFVKKYWIITRGPYEKTPGVKSGTFECKGNFFKMIAAMFIHEIRYPKI